MSELHGNVIKATKWSAFTELFAKLVTPVTTMILARLLTPESFGIMVTAVLVISFAEIFTDAGFQKYLVQNQFSSKESLYKATNVAFISNFLMSIVIWIVIIIFCQQIAELVGSKHRGDVIAVSCACIPLSAFSSIQMALFKKALDFKTLFVVRIVGICVPLIVTIPLALTTRSYWSLIIGMIALQLSNAIILTCKSEWKPKIWYSWPLFNSMFSFTVWSMLEALSIWLTSYCDIFIVGHFLNDYYLGIYRTSMTTVGQIMGIISAATTPVLFSSLSKVQNNDEEFQKILFRFQKTVGLILIPMSVGIFIFRDFITYILLGSQWHAAAWFIGIWGITSGVTIILSYYCSEVLRAKGLPKLSMISQFIDLIVIIPLVYWGVQKSFVTLCDIRAMSRICLIIPILLITYMAIGISPWKMLSNIRIPVLASIIMGVIGLWIQPYFTEMWHNFLIIVICISIYVGIVCIFPTSRRELFNMKGYITKKI